MRIAPLSSSTVVPVPLANAKFLVVSERSQELSPALMIPTSSLSSSSTLLHHNHQQHDRRGGSPSHPSLVIGKTASPQLYWSLAGVPACSDRHIELWIDDKREIVDPITEQQLQQDATHPVLPGITTRMRCVGSEAVHVFRFSDNGQTSIVVAPGSTEVLFAYDTVVIGPPASAGMCCTLRYLPVLEVGAIGAVELATSSSSSSHCPLAVMSAHSSLLPQNAQRCSVSLEEDHGILTVSQMMSILMADISLHTQHQLLLAAMQQQTNPVTAHRREEVPAIIVVPASSQGAATHASDSDDAVGNSSPCDIIPAPIFSQIKTCRVTERDINVVCNEATVRGNKKRARSAASTVVGDSQTTSDSPAAPQSDAPFSSSSRHLVAQASARRSSESCPSSTAPPRKPLSSSQATNDSSSGAGCAASCSPRHRVLVASATQSPVSSIPDSLAESLDERWDERLMALEARAAATASRSPQKMNHGNASSSGVVLHYQPSYHRQNERHVRAQESQLVYFGQSQEDE